MPDLSSLHLIYRLKLKVESQYVWDWHKRLYTFDRLMPPHSSYELLKRAHSLESHAKFEVKYKLFKIWPIYLQFIREGYVAGLSYSDRLQQGPIYSYCHEYRFLPISQKQSLLEERLEFCFSSYRHLNEWMKPYIQKRIDQIFTWRHHITKWDFELWKRFPFNKQVIVLDANFTTHPLTNRLKVALQPFSSAGKLDDFGMPLTQSTEGPLIVLNALNYRSTKLPSSLVYQLQRYHSHVLICLTHRPQEWHEQLKVYTDRLICIHLAPRLVPTYWLKLRVWLGYKPAHWCCEEDIESAIFQLIHERPSSGYYSLGFNQHTQSKLLALPSRLQRWLATLRGQKATQHPSRWPELHLKLKAFDTITSWINIYRKV